jgi:hypothetical protein
VPLKVTAAPTGPDVRFPASRETIVNIAAAVSERASVPLNECPPTTITAIV